MAHHFEEFRLSGVPWKKWGGRSLYVLSGEERSRVFQSNSAKEEHAEDVMLKEMKVQLYSHAGHTTRVTVYQNASPCSDCSENYVDLISCAKDDLRMDLRLTIVFVALYKIRRPSRKNIHNCSPDVHKENLDGLKRLRGLGVKFRCFHFSDWCQLREYLGMLPWSHQDYFGSTVHKDNMATSNDLEILLGTNSDSDHPERVRSMASTSDEKSFDAFWRSGLHGPWCWTARSLYVINGDRESKVFKGCARRHPEKSLLKELRDLLSLHRESTLAVKVYQNYSPCFDCCQDYQDFLRDAQDVYKVDVELQIVFSVLYNIRRPSCEARGCRHMPPEPKHHTALAGLLQLKSLNVQLHCFQYADWRRLGELLRVTEKSTRDYLASSRAQEDVLMSEDVRNLLEEED